MSNNITIGRPYAKAIFSIAKRNNMLQEWDKLLSYLSIMINDENVVHFISNKTITHNEKTRTIIDFLQSYKILNNDIKSLFINFINVLSHYERLLYAKDIYFLYKKYMNLDLNRIVAVIKVACTITSYQKEQIINCLSKKFNKKVSALFEIDKKIVRWFFSKNW